MVADPTPEEILRRRVEIHLARGEHIDAELLAQGETDPAQSIKASLRCSRRRRNGHVTSHRVDRIFAMIAAGGSQRFIAKRLSIARWTVWNQVRILKACVRGMISEGLTDDEIYRRIGRDAWGAWERSKDWADPAGK